MQTNKNTQNFIVFTPFDDVGRAFTPRGGEHYCPSSLRRSCPADRHIVETRAPAAYQEARRSELLPIYLSICLFISFLFYLSLYLSISLCLSQAYRMMHQCKYELPLSYEGILLHLVLRKYCPMLSMSSPWPFSSFTQHFFLRCAASCSDLLDGLSSPPLHTFLSDYDSVLTRIIMYEDAKLPRNTYTQPTQTSKGSLKACTIEYSSKP